ncbi:chorismate lyase [Kushneria sinocarnis]|uniref:Probable chorismate pyruvate-lyase n=1 Tax=Kushneria sinocarnis TaxID=595502 RepID=A0A420X0A4_9GAMM|nr:chorismate lyase [Kushneria sinocarnis]RKR07222.1 chorismate lyase [Kushneria sinocarnis]
MTSLAHDSRRFERPSVLRRWLPLAVAAPQLSPHWRDWLGTRDSLTARLAALVGGTITVRIHAEHAAIPLGDEARRLELPQRRLAWIREVVLEHERRPLIAARSVVPLDELPREVRLLGHRALGQWLFAHPGVTRSAIELTPQALPIAGHHGLGTRRSVFHHRRCRLLVQESFLSEAGRLMAAEPARFRLESHRRQCPYRPR